MDASARRATSDAGWALIMPLIVILGIRFGLLTDTEAAAASRRFMH